MTNFMDIKKYQIQVGRQQKRNVPVKEAIKQLKNNSNNAEKAIKQATN